MVFSRLWVKEDSENFNNVRLTRAGDVRPVWGIVEAFLSVSRQNATSGLTVLFFIVFPPLSQSVDSAAFSIDFISPWTGGMLQAKICSINTSDGFFNFQQSMSMSSLLTQSIFASTPTMGDIVPLLPSACDKRAPSRFIPAKKWISQQVRPSPNDFD